eukprot:TRINITY_DN1967_c0_g1_i2.p1 TRINITY_DN1967_c0_g1~~TRINITY_DN1967_c0_g1_i2.p1  ORF type:complete len:618 (-),score=129.83 TRINITY_DN1967_c0_g1_i2:34-1887(-)
MSKTVDDGWPQYNYSGYNKIKVSVMANFICLSHIDIALSFTSIVPHVDSLTPSCGAADGGTQVTFFGTSLPNSTELQCEFGGTMVPATWDSSEQLTCTVPPHAAGDVGVTVLLGNRSLVDVPLGFKYYPQVIVNDVEPSEGKVDGGDDLTIECENGYDSKLLACRFVSTKGSHTVTVAAKYKKDTIRCTTPTWPTGEDVRITVSLNNQQFSSSSVRFRYVLNDMQLHRKTWIIATSVVCAFLLGVSLLLVVALLRRRCCRKNPLLLAAEGNIDIDMKEVTLCERIGSGTFGDVFKARWRGAVIAVKKLAPQQLSEEFLQEFQREVDLMKTLRHPNVLMFMGSCMHPPDVCIFMEYMCRGSLNSILRDLTVDIPWDLMFHMLIDAASGCLYLHSCTPPIIHRDLKSHNLLVSEMWRVKVSDFGLAKIMDNRTQTMTACGTPCWTAPEVLRNLHYSEKADVYSFAVVLWECLTREEPYSGMPAFRVIFSVGHEGMRPPIPADTPTLYARLMEDCWDEDPQDRPSFDIILERLTAMQNISRSFTTAGPVTSEQRYYGSMEQLPTSLATPPDSQSSIAVCPPAPPPSPPLLSAATDERLSLLHSPALLDIATRTGSEPKSL